MSDADNTRILTAAWFDDYVLATAERLETAHDRDLIDEQFYLRGRIAITRSVAHRIARATGTRQFDEIVFVDEVATTLEELEDAAEIIDIESRRKK